jgi:hypothetical protein
MIPMDDKREQQIFRQTGGWPEDPEDEQETTRA